MDKEKAANTGGDLFAGRIIGSSSGCSSSIISSSSSSSSRSASLDGRSRTSTTLTGKRSLSSSSSTTSNALLQRQQQHRRKNSQSSSCTTAVLRPQPRQPSNSLEDMKLHKLRYDDLDALGCIGREEEVFKLQGHLHNLVSGKTERSLVLVDGYSGVGKSTFVHRTVRDVLLDKKKKSSSSNSTTSEGKQTDGSHDNNKQQEKVRIRKQDGYIFATAKFEQQTTQQHLHQQKQQQQHQSPPRNVDTTKGTEAIAPQHQQRQQQQQQQQQNSRPYSAILDICGEICWHILMLDDQEEEEYGDDMTTHTTTTTSVAICTAIKTELGNEIDILKDLIPALDEIIETASSSMAKNDIVDTSSSKMMMMGGSNSSYAHHHHHHHRQQQQPSDYDGGVDEINTSTSISNNAGEAKYRLRYAFQRIMRIIVRFFVPLVLVIDDLQWADRPSLELLEAMLFDTNNSGLFVVGIYRTNEIDDGGVVATSLRDIQHRYHADRDIKRSLDINTISMGNLNVESVNTVVQTLLRDDSTRTVQLAEVCYKKTHGNVFFLLHFLEMLCESQLLTFSFGTMQWHWNEDDIETKTIASDNVVELLKLKMARLPDDKALFLKLASCLGTVFEKKNLTLLWMEFNSDSELLDDNYVENALSFLEFEGYILGNKPTRHNGVSYIWVHDSIQEAATSLVPEEERSSFNYRVGEILLDSLDETSRQSVIFVLVNLLNDCEMDALELSRRIQFARLNYEACKRSMSMSAFNSAEQFAAKGIELLGENRWTTNYTLTLELYTCIAEASCDLGDFETIDLYCEEVINSKGIPTDDKLSIYINWLDSLHARGDTKRAIDEALRLLEAFGCFFPRTSIGIYSKIILRIIEAKRSVNHLHLEALEPMKDEQKLKLVTILSRLSEYTYVSQSPLLPLVILKSWKWTWKYGVSSISPTSLAQTGAIFTGVLHDLESGAVFAEQALKLVDVANCPSAKADTYFIVYGSVFPFTRPFRQLLKPSYEGYEIGMHCGNVDSATWAIWHHLAIRMVAGGCSLESLEADFRTYEQQMRNLKRVAQVKLTILIRQFCLCLLGPAGNQRWKLVGDLLSEEEHDVALEDGIQKATAQIFEGVLLCIYGKYVEHADASLRRGIDYIEKTHPCSLNIMLDYIMMGVSFFAAAQQTGKRKYCVGARKVRRKIRSWVEQGNPNVYVADLLLSAEQDVLCNRNHSAARNYKAAFMMAARGGVFHEAMIASERMVLFYKNVMKDEDEVTFRIKDTMKYASEWGAYAKVEQLREMYGDLQPTPSQIFVERTEMSN